MGQVKGAYMRYKLEEAAIRQWREEAMRAVQAVAQQGEEFTTAEVWVELWGRKVGTIGEPRNLGPVMQKAERLGVIEKTDRFRSSNYAVSHRRPRRLWRPV